MRVIRAGDSSRLYRSFSRLRRHTQAILAGSSLVSTKPKKPKRQATQAMYQLVRPRVKSCDRAFWICFVFVVVFLALQDIQLLSVVKTRTDKHGLGMTNTNNSIKAT